MALRRIGPLDQLELGTKVQVGNNIGFIIKVELVESSNRAGLICKHTIEFTHKRERLFGSRFRIVQREKSKIESINYASINVVID